MKIVKFLILCLSICCLVACGGTNESSGSIGGSASMSQLKSNVDVSLFNESKEIRLSSYQTGTEESIIHYLKQKAPYNDNYKFKTNKYTMI